MALVHNSPVLWGFNDISSDESLWEFLSVHQTKNPADQEVKEIQEKLPEIFILLGGSKEVLLPNPDQKPEELKMFKVEEEIKIKN